MKHLSIVLALSVFLVACGEQKAGVESETQEITMGEPEASQAAKPLADSSATISGNITYDGQVVLPGNAKVVVRLVDISKRESGTTVLSTHTAGLEGAPPYPFELSYDKSLIDDNGVYVVRAVVKMGKVILFTGAAQLASFSEDDVNNLSVKLAEFEEG